MIDTAGSKPPDRTGTRILSTTGRPLTPVEQHRLGARLSRRGGNQAAKERRLKRKEAAIEAALPYLNDPEPFDTRTPRARRVALIVIFALLILIVPTVLSLIFDH
jgi:hypothetical protein